MPLILTALDVTDPNGDGLIVAFHEDANGSGELDAGDMLLGTGTQVGADWTLSAATSGLLHGVSDRSVPRDGRF